MSKFAEIQILKAEERTMMEILSKMNDQLNRLKVEEMALMSQIRSAQEDPIAAVSAPVSLSTSIPPSELIAENWTESSNDLPVLELQVKQHKTRELDEEEEEDDDEEEEEMEEEPESAHDQLTAFLKQLQSNC